MWYDAGHNLGGPSLRDQGLWLQQQIGIDAQALQ
jgi:hypothetical protein